MTPDEKQKELNQLSDVIKLHGDKLLTYEQRAKLGELQARLEYRTAELEREYREKELDMKLDIIKQVADVWKS